MTHGRDTNTIARKHPHLSEKQKRQRKKELLERGRSSSVASIAESIVIKAENMFMLSEPNGSVPAGGKHASGLYFDDVRFLSEHEFRIFKRHPVVLAADAGEGFESIMKLSNPVFPARSASLRREAVQIEIWRRLDARQRAMHECISLINREERSARLELSLSFAADFADIFVVRGMYNPTRGRTIETVEWRYGRLIFLCLGRDGLFRRLAVSIWPRPHHCNGTTAFYDVELNRQERSEIRLSFWLSQSERREDVDKPIPEPAEQDSCRRSPPSDSRNGEHPEIITDSVLFNEIFRRATADLKMLRSTLGQRRYYAAGIPWFACLFGRDSLILGLQTLLWDPTIAEDNLLLLTEYQGKETNEWRDEQPGKILHELRIGELARAGAIPHTPYYGSVDATILMLILLCEHARWTGTTDLLRKLDSHVRRALDWIDNYADSDGDGFIDYQSAAAEGLINQGWKDSGDAIVNADGSQASPPIALVEVQGYCYRALRSLAELARHEGNHERSADFNRRADDLRRRFNERFWLDEQQFFAMAIQDGGRPCAVISSNPGQALWTRIVDEQHAERVVHRLMQPDMFSGWGIRTLSANERTYNPMAYHLGSVWPHDNMFIADGFRAYGHHEQANQIVDAVYSAAGMFPLFRVPEMFCGFARNHGRPVRHPVACHPQAWGAGSVVHMLTNMLGIRPRALQNKLDISQPSLVPGVAELTIKRLQIGRASVDIRFSRHGNNVQVDVLNVVGELEVVVRPSAD